MGRVSRQKLVNRAQEAAVRDIRRGGGDSGRREDSAYFGARQLRNRRGTVPPIEGLGRGTERG